MTKKGRVQIEVVLLDLATRGLARVQGMVAGLGAFARTAALRLTGMVAAFTGLTGTGVIAYLTQTNRQFEKLLAQLHTFEGSADAARSTFTVLERFAATTPFQIEEAVQAFITLRSIGIQPTEDMLRAFGDTASAMGGRINDFALAVKGAVTGETERLKMFGVTASIAGDQITLRFQDQAITVKRAAADVAAALEQIGATKFSGAMAREMDTLNGAISNLQDNLGRIARAIGEAGFTGQTKGAVRSLVEWTGRLADNREAIQRWTTAIADTLRIVMQSFRVFLAFLGTVEARWNKFNAFMSTRLSETPNMLAEKMRRHTGLVDDADAAFKRALDERVRLIEERGRTFRESVAREENANLRAMMDVSAPSQFRGMKDAKLGGDSGKTSEGTGVTGKSTADTAADKLKERIALYGQLAETGNISAAGLAAAEQRLRAELARTETTLAERIELEQMLLKIREQLAALGAPPEIPAVDKIITEQIEKAGGLTPPKASSKGTPAVDLGDLSGIVPADAADEQTVWERLSEQVVGARTEMEMLRDTIDDITTGSLVAFGDAIMEAFAAMISGSQSAGAALGKAILGFLGNAAKAFGDFYIAKAIASFASVTAVPPNPAGAVAGKKYLLAAAGMYALAGAAGGAAAAVGGGGGSGGGSAAARGFGTTNGLAGAAKGDAYLIVEGDFLDLNNPITKARFKRALEEFSGRRVHLRNNRFGTIKP